MSEGNFGRFAQQRHDNFLVRINIDLVVAAMVNRYAALCCRSAEQRPKTWWGGPFVACLLPHATIASMTPWARATRVMDDYFQGF